MCVHDVQLYQLPIAQRPCSRINFLDLILVFRDDCLALQLLSGSKHAVMRCPFFRIQNGSLYHLKILEAAITIQTISAARMPSSLPLLLANSIQLGSNEITNLLVIAQRLEILILSEAMRAACCS